LRGMLNKMPTVFMTKSLFKSMMLAGLVILAFAGCASKPRVDKPPTHRVLRLTHRDGGAHHRTVVHNDVWYQTFGPALLVVNPEHATSLREIELGPEGETGPAIDLIVDHSRQRLLTIIEDDEIVELSLDAPLSPTIVDRISAQALGIKPRRFSMI